jgi:GMP synthase (glutamine-hydrolysing)
MDKILIIDFGSQYTQLIARKIRELNVYCEIHPFNNFPEPDDTVKGVILSGSPFSVRDENAPDIDFAKIKMGKLPVLGICYGAQLITQKLGGLVDKSKYREYGRAELIITDEVSPIFKDINQNSQVWMSHADTIITPARNSKVIAKTNNIDVAAFKIENEDTYGLQFHPEVFHSTEGQKILRNFAIDICDIKPDWTPASFVETTIEDLKKKLGNDKVVLGLSGGVDSTVAAMLLHRAIGKNLYCIFVNTGLLRKNEFSDVLKSYEGLGLNVIGVDASEEFLSKLEGVEEPEQKRKIIGSTFIDVFDREAKKIKDVKWLGQGTIYPDVIESISVKGPSVTIKSHHNVGGLPEKMNLKVVEPLRLLFKDEVRRVGRELNIPAEILNRHPFPGPGLAIRIIGAITKERVRLLQEADDIFISALKEFNLYDKVWQAATILLPIKSVGVMGDERTYENVVALRAVNSTDGMTADWSRLPYEFLAEVSNRIINRVKGINRVVYDISSKPPATIEWE